MLFQLAYLFLAVTVPRVVGEVKDHVVCPTEPTNCYVWNTLISGVAEVIKLIARKEARNLAIQEAILANVTTELNILKGRQAAVGGVSILQLIIFLTYLATIAGIAAYKCWRRSQKAQLEDNLEMMEQRLQARRAQRKSSARVAAATS